MDSRKSSFFLAELTVKLQENNVKDEGEGGRYSQRPQVVIDEVDAEATADGEHDKGQDYAGYHRARGEKYVLHKHSIGDGVK